MQRATCPKCDGKGITENNERCLVCDGSGKIELPADDFDNKKFTCIPSSDQCILKKTDKEELRAMLAISKEVVKMWKNGDKQVSEIALKTAFELSKKLDEKFGYFLTGAEQTPDGFLDSIESIECIELHNHDNIWNGN